MENKCDFCSKQYEGNGIAKDLNGRQVCLCKECAERFDALSSSNQIIQENAEYWFKKNFSYNPQLLQDLNLHRQQTRIINMSSDNTSIWIVISKTLSYIFALITTILGGAIGRALGMMDDEAGDIILGVLIGIIVGLSSIGLTMVFLNMAKDVKKIANKK